MYRIVYTNRKNTVLRRHFNFNLIFGRLLIISFGLLTNAIVTRLRGLKNLIDISSHYNLYSTKIKSSYYVTLTPCFTPICKN